MFDKVKEFVCKWSNKTVELWEERHYIRSTGTFLPPVVLAALLIFLIIKTIIVGFNFVRLYYAQLIFAAFAICAFVAWLDKRKADNIENERRAQEIRERQDYSDKLEAAQTEEFTYTTQAKVIFSVSREVGPLGIVPPATLSHIYSPGRTIPVAKGTVNLNLFLLQKDRETVDTDLLKHTLQTKINQRLQAGEFPGIPDQYVYRGRVYSGLVVDRVRDSAGGFVEVYTAFVDDAYCRYQQNRKLNSYRLLSPTDRRDTDY